MFKNKYLGYQRFNHLLSRTSGSWLGRFEPCKLRFIFPPRRLILMTKGSRRRKAKIRKQSNPQSLFLKSLTVMTVREEKMFRVQHVYWKIRIRLISQSKSMLPTGSHQKSAPQNFCCSPSYPSLPKKLSTNKLMKFRKERSFTLKDECRPQRPPPTQRNRFTRTD